MSKILIVEDEPNLRILYEKEFSEEGYDVVFAKDGKEAIQKTKEHAPDLIIMDLRLPQLDGIEAMRLILEINKDIPIIINSAYSSYQDDFMSWAAKAYVIKTSDLTELKNKVAEFI